MIISLRADGTAVMLEPSHVYQGSNVAEIYVIAPFPYTTSLQLGFKLPDGTNPSGVMNPAKIDNINNLMVWSYNIPSAITNEAGEASLSITAFTTSTPGNEPSTKGQQIVSQSIPFTIEATTLPVLPDLPPENQWDTITKYVQQNSKYILDLQEDVSEIAGAANTANENASAALTTAQSAESTAQQAQTTANGLASSIEQANTNASAAVQTANQAASDVGQYTSQIAEANTNASEALDKATQAEQTVGTFDAVLNEASTNAENAVTTANAAQQTAEAAQTTANSFAAQIETANTNASAAVSTAQGAKTTVQGIENGTTPAGNSSKLGGIPAGEYAQLSQVVRSDVLTNLNIEEKLRVQDNIGLNYLSSTTGNLTSSGWHTISRMNQSKQNGKSGVLYIKKMYAQSSPSSFILTYNQTGYAKPLLMVQANTNTSGYKFRLFTDSEIDEAFIQIYNPENKANTWYISGVSSRNLEMDLTVDDTVDLRETNSLSQASEIDVISNGINTTGDICQQGASVLAVDPTKLTPSTANGWSEGGETLIPSSAGKYFIAIDEIGGKGVGEVIYDGTIGYGYLVVSVSLGVSALYSVIVNSNGTYLTPSTGSSTFQPTTVYYKKQ